MKPVCSNGLVPQPDHRSALGISALSGVIGVAALVAATSFANGFLPTSELPIVAGSMHTAASFGLIVLLFDANPLFEAYAGPRIQRWNRWVYLGTLLAVAAIVVFL